MAAGYWKSLGIVLRVVDYSETSQIATVFTRERGKVGVIAKGAKRKGSALIGLLEPLTLVEVVCVKRRESAGLHTLTELDLRDTFRGARQALGPLHAALYVVELLREIAPEDEPLQDVFDLAVAALARIARPPWEPIALMAFEARALELLGHFPLLDACAECGSQMEQRVSRKFSAQKGGVLCPTCGHKDRAARDASPGALSALLALGRDPALAARLRIAPAQQAEIRGMLSGCVAAAIERPLRMARYL